MPTYEYDCEGCGQNFEYFQSMSEPAKATCEQCGGTLRKLLSAGAGLIFKGSGFYITDYKNSGGGKTAEADGKTSGAASGESKSETAAAAKPDSPPANSTAKAEKSSSDKASPGKAD
jgi:putative FmdB family regulatory protein